MQWRFLGLFLAVLLGLAVWVWAVPAEITSVAQLREATHIHGIAVAAHDPAHLYLATHHGFFRVALDGQVTRLSEDRNDYMGFTPHPTDPDVLYASGHPAGGGNLGFIASSDGGNTWRRLAPGVNGPVDFHQLDVSKANPQVIYGAYGGLQVSKDGGRRWALVGPLPEKLIDLAASARQVDRLYAATEAGLLSSADGGRSWQTVPSIRQPVTLVHTTAAGEVYAFVVGAGLLKATEPELVWTPVSQAWGKRYVLHLTVDPTDPARLYAVTGEGEILASSDGGRSWTVFASGSSR
jgi:photosystem II stability/assembly factor-like uncharacterized protein